jgi:DNA-binding transcriptional ArsR family regulator
MKQEVKVVRNPEVIEIGLEETRRKILSLLAVSDMTVSQIVEILGKDQSTIYRHIEKLLDADYIYVVGERKRAHIPEKIYGRTASVFILSPDLEDKKESTILYEFRKHQAEVLAKVFYGCGIGKSDGEDTQKAIIEIIDEMEARIAPVLEKIPSEISLSPQDAWRLKTMLILYSIMHDRELHDRVMQFFKDIFV